jgi:hypothetical protein
MLFKRLVISAILLSMLPLTLFADHWRNRYPRYPRYYQTRPIYNYYPNYNYRHIPNGNVSPGAATAIGLGAGVVGFVIGRSTKSKEKEIIYRDTPKIECKEFDIRVTIDGESKKAKIMKCRSSEDGDWKIPD